MTPILVPEPPLVGDYSGDNELNLQDLNLQAAAIASMADPPAFDLTGDGRVNYDDRLNWVKELKGTSIGDANLDGEFNSGDMVQVFVSGKYETKHKPTGQRETGMAIVCSTAATWSPPLPMAAMSKVRHSRRLGAGAGRVGAGRSSRACVTHNTPG